MLSYKFYESALENGNNSKLGFEISPMALIFIVNNSNEIIIKNISYNVKIEPNTELVYNHVFDNYKPIGESISSYINDNVHKNIILLKNENENNNLDVIFSDLNDCINSIVEYKVLGDDNDLLYRINDNEFISDHILNGELFGNILTDTGLSSLDANISYDYQEKFITNSYFINYNHQGSNRIEIISNPFDLKFDNDNLESYYYHRFSNLLRSSILFDINSTPGSDLFGDIVTPDLGKIIYKNLSSNNMIYQFDIENASSYSNLKEIIDSYNVPILSTSVLTFFDNDGNSIIPRVLVYDYESIEKFHRSYMDVTKTLYNDSDNIDKCGVDGYSNFTRKFYVTETP